MSREEIGQQRLAETLYDLLQSPEYERVSGSEVSFANRILKGWSNRAEYTELSSKVPAGSLRLVELATHRIMHIRLLHPPF